MAGPDHAGTKVSYHGGALLKAERIPLAAGGPATGGWGG